ncbi:MAG: hypothetical protein V4685_19485 [Bacteroidota bacterium]
MKHNFLLATGVAALLAFSSCKKDEPGTPAQNNPGVTKQLKKITKTEAGTVTVYNLTYDAAKRLTSYKSTDNKEYVFFTYDANGNLTNVEQKDTEFKNIYAYTFANNIPVSATFKSWEVNAAGQPGDMIEDDKLTYTVTNNQVSKIKLEMLQDATEINLLMTYSNGNLTKVASEGMAVYTATFTFGNKKSALPKVTNWILDQAGFSLQFGANNDMLSVAYDFPGTAADRSVNTTYTYDSNGYVLTSNDGAAQQVFEYQ